jgi:hypothetical protein
LFGLSPEGGPTRAALVAFRSGYVVRLKLVELIFNVSSANNFGCSLTKL